MEPVKVFLRVIGLARSELWLVRIFLLAGLAIGSAQMIEPILFGRVVDALSKAEHFGTYVGLWVALGLTNASLSIFLSIVSDRYAHRMRLRAMEAAFARTIALPYREHSLQGSGRVVRTIQSGADLIFNMVLSFFRENFIALTSVLLIIPMSFFLAPKLACVLLGLALVYGVANSLIVRHTHGQQAIVETKHQTLTARIVDVMANVTIVRAFTRVQQEVSLFAELVQGVLRAQYPVLNWWGVLNVLTRLSSMTAMLIIVAIGANLVQSGQASQGEIVTFVGFSNLMIARLDQFSAFINRTISQLPILKNLFKLLDHQGEDDGLSKHFTGLTPAGRVRFENVSFRYGQNTGKNKQGVFDLNFTVEPGETIALVGATGAGKSTCLALLQRLYHPDTGRILIDEQNIRDLEVNNLCRAIATVFQEPGLFNRSIFDNIEIGCPGASLSEVETAARLAYAHDFIVDRPEGYDFVVGERGLALSGGERQRIAIARAILKNAPILILDEATSALDNATEKLVQAAMDRLRRGKTTFVIAHRLSTVLNADRIFVMQDGRIEQVGSFEQLRHEAGLFARLLHAGELGEPTPETTANQTDHRIGNNSRITPPAPMPA